jgi:hypothetical protein
MRGNIIVPGKRIRWKFHRAAHCDFLVPTRVRIHVSLPPILATCR